MAIVGDSLWELLHTPAIVVHRDIAAKNCRAMVDAVEGSGAAFRAHIKTHKTVEGTRLQLQGSQYGRIICSTVQEVDGVRSLVDEGVVRDILYGVPASRTKVRQLVRRYVADRSYGAALRFMCDSIGQARALAEEAQRHDCIASIFIKVDCGYHRAGVAGGILQELVRYILLDREAAPHLHLYGVYTHAGHSYQSTSLSEAEDLLDVELRYATEAAKFARSLRDVELVLSVGATPTAHAFEQRPKTWHDAAEVGQLEVHAGCYPFNDLQQYGTGLPGYEHIGGRVLTEVLSHYPGRAALTGASAGDEYLIDAGCLALGREVGPIKGFGLSHDGQWVVSRVAQEHGVLAAASALPDNVKPWPAMGGAGTLSEGDRLLIIPQHMCIAAANFADILIVDSFGANAKVVDIWHRFPGH